MTDRAYLSLRDVAELMEIEPLRLIRLGRCLGMASMDRRIPRSLVFDVMRERAPEDRYRAFVQALLGSETRARTAGCKDEVGGRAERQEEAG